MGFFHHPANKDNDFFVYLFYLFKIFWKYSPSGVQGAVLAVNNRIEEPCLEAV